MSAREPAERARDQIGIFFLVLSVALACGAVAAGNAPRGEFLRHGVMWWLGFAAGFMISAMTFTILPWTLRNHFRVAPAGAAADATKGFYVLVGGTLVLIALDAGVIGLLRATGMRGVPAMILGWAGPPLAACELGWRIFKGRPAGRPVVALAGAFWNAILVEWATTVAGTSLLR